MRYTRKGFEDAVYKYIVAGRKGVEEPCDILVEVANEIEKFMESEKGKAMTENEMDNAVRPWLDEAFKKYLEENPITRDGFICNGYDEETESVEWEYWEEVSVKCMASRLKVELDTVNDEFSFRLSGFKSFTEVIEFIAGKNLLDD